MRVLRLHAPGDVRLHDEAGPEVGAGEELVRVTAVGLCGSDLHWWHEGGIGDAVIERPLVLGHEAGGVIVSGRRAGLRVAIDPADPCERCEACVAGAANLCRSLRFLGHGTTDGALRGLIAWPAARLLPVPDGIADDAVPLLEPLGVALHAIDLGPVSAASRVAVVGCGPIGLLLIGALRAVGILDIVAVEPLAHRAAAALVAGAAELVGLDADGVPTRRSGRPVDVAFETAGTDLAVGTALDLVRPGGRVLLAGIPTDDRTSFRAGTARRKGLTLVMVRRMQARHLVRAAAMADRGLIDLDPLITARHPLAEGATAFAALARREGLKVVVRPSD